MFEQWVRMKQEDIDKLKQIHFKKTGAMLSDQDALEMGTRIVNFFRIVAKPIPEDIVESDE